jgi:hypothetical protein
VKRLLCIIAAVLASGLSATAASAYTSHQALSKMQDSATAGPSCNANGYSYTGVRTPKGQSGFVAGSPASPITRTTIIEPMKMDMTSTDSHSLAYWAVGSNVSLAHESWLQVGVEVGWAPGNGWNNAGSAQYLGNGPTMYVEYVYHFGEADESYYFSTVGASSGIGHYDYYSLRQETDGTFSALVNSVVVLSHVVVPQGDGRNVSGDSEDENFVDALCENQDFYFEMQTPETGLTKFTPTWSPLKTCAISSGGSSPFYDWETWNKAYTVNGLHGTVPRGVGSVLCIG